MISTRIVLDINIELEPDDSRFIIPLYEVGDGVSIMGYSDIDPGTIVNVTRGGKEIHVKKDKATLNSSFKPIVIIGGFAGHCVNQNEQKWDIESDSDGYVSVHTLRTWRGIKIWAVKGGSPNGKNSISPDRYKFYDYNF